MNNVPILFEKLEECCGCAACVNICPQKAIKMQEDTEGFLYPFVELDKCIKCHLCEKVCALKRDKDTKRYNQLDEDEPNVFAVKHKEDEVRMNSRSGGMFTAITDYILKNDGVVYGAALTQDFCVEHMRTETKEGRNLMRGSKYIQSKIGNMFKSVKDDLEKGRSVLFSGTSCQVAGLKGYLQKDYEKLICLDIVCHGVPSPLVWKKYLTWQENRYGKCVAVDFRNKIDFGWTNHVETMEFEKDGKTRRIHSRIYTELFYGHAILRPVCYECPYKSIYHPGDITIADFWGIEKAVPGFSDNKGVSLVLINNAKGKEYFDCIKKDLKYQKAELQKCLQPPLIKPFPKPDNREEFWKDFGEKPFSYIANIYGKNRINYKIKRIYHKWKERFRQTWKSDL